MYIGKSDSNVTVTELCTMASLIPVLLKTMYLGKSDSSHPRNQVMFVRHTEMHNRLLHLVERTIGLRGEGNKVHVKINKDTTN